MELLATVISRIFEPAILFGIIFIIGAMRVGVGMVPSFVWLCILLGPTLAYRFRVKAREHLDWDIKDRKRRIKPLASLLMFLGIATGAAWIIDPRLLPIFSLFFLWAIGFFAVTALWTKISGHTATAAVATGFLISWYGWSWWPILLIVPFVGWARVVTKNHTVGQVIAGAFYSWILLVFIR